eukprot:scaffold130855_cov14-Tisochrysis_lutea.AAC.1
MHAMQHCMLHSNVPCKLHYNAASTAMLTMQSSSSTIKQAILQCSCASHAAMQPYSNAAMQLSGHADNPFNQ